MRSPFAVTALVAFIASGCGRGGSEAEELGQAAAVQFLDELRAGHLETAWQATSTEFKSLMGLENLRDLVKSHPALKVQAEFDSTRPTERNGQPMNEYVFHATPPPTRRRKPNQANQPKQSTIIVLAAPGDQGWRVEQIRVD